MATSDQLAANSVPLPEMVPIERDSSQFDENELPFTHNWPLVLFGLLFAFLLASFPVRSSDILLHLASGRNLLAGTAAADSIGPLNLDFRIQQFLLYDLLVYGFHAAFGGFGLVLAKAILVAGIAWMMIRMSRLDTDSWLPVVCTTLAMLAMGIRMLLQPALVSCFLLTLALFLIRDREQSPVKNKSAVLPPWPLVILFAVWANIDSWFVVGLAVVAIFWLGQILDHPGTFGERIKQLAMRTGWVAVLAGACLVNPSHIHAYSAPAELGGAVQSAASLMAMATKQITSPFQRPYLATIARTPAGMAYYPLLGLGLLSFALNFRHLRWQRLLPWLALAALSAWQARAIPFFAVWGGPVLAWNLQEILARYSNRPSWQPSRWPVGPFVRGPVTIFAASALLVCAWPGWLQSPPFEPRHWAIELPPSLENTALNVNRLRQEGKLPPETRWLHLSPETAWAFAWFSPNESGLFDRQMSAAIRGEVELPNLAERMHAAGVNRLIVYDADRSRLMAALERLEADPLHWTFLRFEGDIAIFEWHESAPPADTDPVLDFANLAYRPADTKKAPPRPPEPEPRPRRWSQAFWKRAPRRTIDGDEATLLLVQAEVLRRPAPHRHMLLWEASHSASLIGASVGWSGAGGLFDARVRLSLLRPQLPETNSSAEDLSVPDRTGLMMQERFAFQQDDTPPALLYLAIRAARRAVYANPDDAQAFLVLGECYVRLLRGTRERVWGARLQELTQLRRVQASAALNQAIALNPNLAQAHLNLSELYREMSYLDLTLKHLRIYLDLIRRSAGKSGAITEEFRKQEAQYQKEIDRLSKQLEQQSKSFSTNSAKAKLLERAKGAKNLGLAEKARDMLLESDIAAFGPEGAALELELLLNTGRFREARDWISADQAATLGAPSYYWIRAQAQAAAGNYAEAQLECDRLARAVAYEESGKEPIRLHQVMAMMIGQAVLEEHPGITPIPMLAYRAYLRMNFREEMTSLVRRMRQEADATVIRGLLALEEGDSFEARFAFRTALTLWKDQTAAAAETGIDFNGRPAAEAWLERLKLK